MPEARSRRTTPSDTNKFDIINVIKEKFDKLKVSFGSRESHEKAKRRV